LKVLLTEDRHAPNFDDFFPTKSRDAFHESDVLNATAKKWYSILIVHGSMAFHNSFALSPIDGTNFFDIEPFMGYAGPLTTTSNKDFLSEALEAYSCVCRRFEIVAELARFDPILSNHAAFFDLDAIKIAAVKQVVIVNCPRDDSELIAQFSHPCRRDIRLGLRRRRFARLEGPIGLFQFRTLYEASVRRLKSGDQWLFSNRLYDQAVSSDLFAIYGVYDGEILVSASLVLHHPRCSHYMLAANVKDYPQGASELLIYGIARESAKRGIDRLILGGGITSAPEDGLLRFKRKFATASSTFYVGKLIHDLPRYSELCTEALAAEPSLASSPFFLKYRRQA
jgi:hypothetical protein